MNLAPLEARYIAFFHIAPLKSGIANLLKQLGDSVLHAAGGGVVQSGLVGARPAHVEVGIDILHGARLLLTA